MYLNDLFFPKQLNKILHQKSQHKQLQHEKQTHDPQTQHELHTQHEQQSQHEHTLDIQHVKKPCPPKPRRSGKKKVFLVLN